MLGAVITVVVVGVGGITIAYMARPAKNQNTSPGVILMALHDRPIIEYRSFNMMEIKRCYPITQSFYSDEIILLDQPFATQEHILVVLNVMLKNFSESKQAFEESLPALESIEMSSKIPSGKDNNFAFRPGILFPEDRCDETLTRHASTLYCLLNLAYKKQHEFDMNDSVSYLSNIDNVAKEFRLLLEGLSDKISTYNLHSSAFSLARHAELIGINYHQSRKNKGYYSWFTTPRPHASLVDEIEFLKQISMHSDCDDELRYASLKVLEKKISATTLNTNEPLKKLLDAGISHATCHIHPKICFKKLSDFCHSKDLVPPDELQLYINKIKKESASLSATEATFTH